MGNKDGASARTDRFADQFRIEIPVVRIKINQNWPGPHGDHVVEIPDKIIAGQNDFVPGPDLQRPERQLDREGPAATKLDKFDFVI